MQHGDNSNDLFRGDKWGEDNGSLRETTFSNGNDIFFHSNPTNNANDSSFSFREDSSFASKPVMTQREGDNCFRDYNVVGRS